MPNHSSDKRIGVLMGGLSAEREISLQSGEAVLQALAKRGYEAVPLIVDRDIDVVLRQSRIDLVFNALHGRYGEDGCIQGLLEMMGIPYTGSGVLASALAMNKAKAKEIFRIHNLPTPPAYTLTRDKLDDLEQVHGAFGFPVMVKPAGEGSGLGITLVSDMSELGPACEDALDFDDTILVERYISGKEICVGIVNGHAIGAMGIVSHNAWFDYEAKYKPGYAHYHLPPQLSAERYRGVLTQALRAHQALGCGGATRVDMIVSELGNEYILEVDTLPGLTPLSLLPRVARHAGISYDELIERIFIEARLWGTGSTRRLERRFKRLAFAGPEKRALPAIGLR